MTVHEMSKKARDGKADGTVPGPGLWPGTMPCTFAMTIRTARSMVMRHQRGRGGQRSSPGVVLPIWMFVGQTPGLIVTEISSPWFR